MADPDKGKTVIMPGHTSSTGYGGAHTDDSVTQIRGMPNVEVGRLTIVEGNGNGERRAVYSGSNQLGRSTENKIALNFGDNTISNLQHAVITFDPGEREFVIIECGKPNPIYINGQRLTGQRKLADGDLIRIGLTTLALKSL